MISSFRRYLETWYVRAFFLVMVGSFVLWGVGDMLRVVGTSTWVARISGASIEVSSLETEFHRALATASRDLPAGQEASAALRREVGERTLQRLIAEAAMRKELTDLRIVVPDAVLAEATRLMPVFRGASGNFDRLRFESLLRANGLTESAFLAGMRDDISRRQLLEAVSAATRVPEAQSNPIYKAQFEKRSADLATFPIAAIPEPPTPDEATVHRFYDNHPDLYATPEYRTVKAALLSTRLMATEISISDADARAYYEAHLADHSTIARRSAQVISAPEEGAAKALAETWRGGADWAAMEAAAKTAGAVAISQDDATEKQFPDPDLAKAVFAAEPGTVSEPIKGRLGWFVVRVGKATAGGTTPFEEVKDKIRERVSIEKALEMVYDKANKADGALANGTALDTLPGTLGLGWFAATTDKNGYGPDGSPVPLPGENELRAAVLASAFASPKGEPPHLIEVATPSTGGSGYYALIVEDIVPAGMKPFEAVRDAAAADWRAEQRRKGAEQAAAAMLQAIKDGKTFSDAARDAGITPRLSPVVARSTPDPGLPLEVHRVLFGLKQTEPTMVETPEGFVVAMPVEIVVPDPAADPAGYQQLRAAVSRSIANDLATTLSEAVRLRSNPRINQTNFDQVVQP